mmetsp:Transcript_20781/g.33649  ORF Transcript_20781/g.33649 Transcript_20781/m.33649 type:complete len:229 (+) Transcript_20781:25-711(+)
MLRRDAHACDLALITIMSGYYFLRFCASFRRCLQLFRRFLEIGGEGEILVKSFTHGLYFICREFQRLDKCECLHRRSQIHRTFGEFSFVNCLVGFLGALSKEDPTFGRNSPVAQGRKICFKVAVIECCEIIGRFWDLWHILRLQVDDLDHGRMDILLLFQCLAEKNAMVVDLRRRGGSARCQLQRSLDGLQQQQIALLPRIHLQGTEMGLHLIRGVALHLFDHLRGLS